MAAGILSLLLISLLALIALSVKNSRLAKDRAKAVALAQEGVELMRTFRDLSWTGVIDKVSGTAYNFPENWTVLDDLTTSCPTENNIEDFFKRCVLLTLGAEEAVEIEVTVSWQEGNQVQKTVQTTTLSLWER